MRSPFGARIVAGLQYAATAFYAVAVAHGLWLDRRGGDADTRAWATTYATAATASFLVGWRRAGSRRAGDRTRRARVTVLLVLFYGFLRTSATLSDRFEGEGGHRRGAAAEALALLLAYALASASRIVARAGKTQ